jgi:hypothetical protein
MVAESNVSTKLEAPGLRRHNVLKFLEHVFKHLSPRAAWHTESRRADGWKLMCCRHRRPAMCVIGTVFGDIHSIGKDIVATLLSTEGFEVIDVR